MEDSMIRINSFIPTNNFTRRIWEFHEDKIVVKTKSLTIDAEKEIKYSKIKFIMTKKSADLNWLWITFAIFGILAVTGIALNFFGFSSSITELIGRIIATFALLLMILSFRKYEFYYFLDAEKYHLANVIIDNDQKRAQITEAINRIKQKTEIITEIYLSDPLPHTPPLFEIVEFDFPDFLNKSTTRFYHDKIIETHKSIVEEFARVTRYDELNGKAKTSRVGNDNWDYVWCYWMLFVCLAGLSAFIFFPKQISGNPLFLRLFFGGLALLIPMSFLKYIKNEFMVFTDNNDDGVLGIGINTKNRETLNQIAEFVRGKVESKKTKPA